MKNKEKYKEKLIDMFVVYGKKLAVKKGTHEICDCYDASCRECLFADDKRACIMARKEWLNAEYEEPVDWSKIAVDTPILVSNDNKQWHRRYFAEYKDGFVCTWDNGATSWSAIDAMSPWQYATLKDREQIILDAEDDAYSRGVLAGIELGKNENSNAWSEVLNELQHTRSASSETFNQGIMVAEQIINQKLAEIEE